MNLGKKPRRVFSRKAVTNKNMARQTFGRTIVLTYCEVNYVDQDDNVKKDTIKLFGDYDMQTAQNAVKKKLNAKGAMVLSVSHKSFYGSMDIEKFAKFCDKKNHKEW